MKMMLKLILAACAAPLLVVGSSARSASAACSCEPLTVSKARDRAEAVFVGTVVESFREVTANGFEWRVRLRVEQTWKGAGDGDELIVYTSGDCMISFDAGKKYLVFARRQEGRGRLITDSCMKTATLDASADDLQKLGKSKERAAATPAPTSSPTKPDKF
jgi:hypothetical protein